MRVSSLIWRVNWSYALGDYGRELEAIYDLRTKRWGGWLYVGSNPTSRTILREALSANTTLFISFDRLICPYSIDYSNVDDSQSKEEHLKASRGT